MRERNGRNFQGTVPSLPTQSIKGMPTPKQEAVWVLQQDPFGKFMNESQSLDPVSWSSHFISPTFFLIYINVHVPGHLDKSTEILDITDINNNNKTRFVILRK